MYIVIYDKITKKIIRVIDKNTPYFVDYGYSDNCTEKIVEEKPEGQYIK